jgi:cbb3-type cytochrome oxidase subunit 1
MDWFAKRFIKASLIWLCVAVLLGLAMAIHPAWTIYRPAHMHAALLGFVAMMIYGVAYHVLPRFSGSPLHSRSLAGWHWWAANLGLGAVVAGFIARVTVAVPSAVSSVVLGLGGSLSALGAFAFAWNIWRTMDGPPLVVVQRASRKAG